MKKKLLLVLALLILLTGCKAKRNRVKDLTIELDKGEYTSVCTKTEEYDGLTLVTTTTTNYDKDKNAINYKILANYAFDDEEQFKYYSDQEYSTYDTRDTYVDYSIDENKMLYDTVTAYKSLNLEEDEKSDLTLSSVVKTAESNGEKCELIGIKRGEIE